MKATDFRREHFANGRSFPQSDFDGYIQASANFAKTLYTKYLPCMAGGISFALGVALLLISTIGIVANLSM